MRAEAILSKRNGSNSCIGCGGGEAARWSFRPIDYSYFTIGLSECDMNRPSSLWLLAFTNKTHFTVRAHHENNSWWASMSRFSVRDILKFSVRGHSVLCLCHFLSDMFCAVLNSAQALFRAILSMSLSQWHVPCKTKLCTSTVLRYSSRETLHK